MEFNFRAGSSRSGSPLMRGLSVMEMLRVELEKERIKKEISERDMVCRRLMEENMRRRMDLARLSAPLSSRRGALSVAEEEAMVVVAPEEMAVSVPEMVEDFGRLPPRLLGSWDWPGPFLALTDNDLRPSEVRPSWPPQKEWGCALCQVSTTNKEDLEIHVNGRKHKWAERAMLHASRASANMGGSASVHLALEKKKKKKMATKKVSRCSKNDMFLCNPCNLVCNSESMLGDHISGKKHRKRCGINK